MFGRVPLRGSLRGALLDNIDILFVHSRHRRCCRYAGVVIVIIHCQCRHRCHSSFIVAIDVVIAMF